MATRKRAADAASGGMPQRMTALPTEVFAVVASKCCVLGLLVLSGSSKAIHTTVKEAADMLLLEMTNAATTIQARLVGGATLYRLARLAGRTVSIPNETLKPLVFEFEEMLDDRYFLAPDDGGEPQPDGTPFHWVGYKVQPEANELLYLTGVLTDKFIAKQVAAIVHELVLLRDVKWPIQLVERQFVNLPEGGANVWALTDDATAQLRHNIDDEYGDEWTGLVIDFALVERAIAMAARNFFPRKV